MEENETFRLFEYDNEGYHDGFIEVSGPTLVMAFRTIIKKALDEKRKVIITDLYDQCVFHMENGEVIFPKVNTSN